VGAVDFLRVANSRNFCWSAVRLAGRRSWVVSKVLIIAADSGCEWQKTLSARPSDGFEEADYPGKVFMDGKFVSLAAISYTDPHGRRSSKTASSTEFMGEFWLRKLAKCVI
jgi:hypothetical protein